MTPIDHRAWTYAQRLGGLKLHIVEKFADGAVADRALCGVGPDSVRGNWRMTINVPLAHACRNCTRISRRGSDVNH
jgi:hypothetical protein